MKIETKPLVLGTAMGYEPAQVSAFVESLKRSGYKGVTALWVDRSNLALQNYLTSEGIEVILLNPAPLWRADGKCDPLPKGILSKAVAGLYCFVPGLLKAAYAVEWAGPLHNISSGRYFHYLHFLEANRDRFSHVLLVDVRDVVFQSDPFMDIPAECLWFFQENPDQTLGSQPDNRRWIEKAYGEKGLKTLQQKGILCSGTTLGSIDLLIKFLKMMTKELIRLTPVIKGAFGFDQPAHNWVYGRGLIPQAEVKQNFHGAVATLGVELPDRFKFDGQGRLLNRDGRPVPVIHQYDRHPALVELLTGPKAGR